MSLLGVARRIVAWNAIGLCARADVVRGTDRSAVVCEPGIDFACGAPDSIREVAMQRMRSCARPLATMRPRARAVRGGVNSEARSPQLRICPAHVLKSYSRPISRSPCIGVRGGVFLRKRVSTIGSRRSWRKET